MLLRYFSICLRRISLFPIFLFFPLLGEDINFVQNEKVEILKNIFMCSRRGKRTAYRAAPDDGPQGSSNEQELRLVGGESIYEILFRVFAELSWEFDMPLGSNGPGRWPVTLNSLTNLCLLKSRESWVYCQTFCATEYCSPDCVILCVPKSITMSFHADFIPMYWILDMEIHTQDYTQSLMTSEWLLYKYELTTAIP